VNKIDGKHLNSLSAFQKVFGTWKKDTKIRRKQCDQWSPLTEKQKSYHADCQAAGHMPF
jgi:hypothetical protein